MGSFIDRQQNSTITFPIIHCLMNSKSSDAYRKVLLEIEAIIKDTFEDQNLKFDARVITTDFELALINISKWFWPKSDHLGCFVHFLRCQINNLKKLGFFLQRIRN